jgi:AraC family transcriptional regulator
MTRRISSHLVLATQYNRSPLEVLDWHEHHNLSFCFVLKGTYEEITRDRAFTCRPGDVVIKPPKMRHQNLFGRVGGVCLLLEISDELIKSSAGLVEPETQGPIHDLHLTRIGLELCQELLAADRLSPIMLETIALRSLVSALRFTKRRSTKDSEVKTIHELLDAGFGATALDNRYLTVQERKSMRRLFYETQGCSIRAYISKRRAFRAFGELLNTSDSLVDIAHRCGFYDQAHFTKVFSTFFGITPGRLRSRVI